MCVVAAEPIFAGPSGLPFNVDALRHGRCGLFTCHKLCGVTMPLLGGQVVKAGHDTLKVCMQIYQ